MPPILVCLGHFGPMGFLFRVKCGAKVIFGRGGLVSCLGLLVWIMVLYMGVCFGVRVVLLWLGNLGALNSVFRRSFSGVRGLVLRLNCRKRYHLHHLVSGRKIFSGGALPDVLKLGTAYSIICTWVITVDSCMSKHRRLRFM